jgi:hypothetical protein
MQSKLLFICGMLAVPAITQMIYVGDFHKSLSAEHYGLTATADIKNLNDLAHSYFDNICKQNGRGAGCYKWVDTQGKSDGNWPQRRVDVTDISKLKYSVR